MGNCQAVDNASLVLQTQNGRAERYYSPVSAAEIMNLHPGHYVALLLTTTFYSSPPNSSSSSDDDHHHRHKQPPNKNNINININNQQQQQPLRVTRIKLLRPTDNLALGHAYRLITSQEVMKGLKAKKNGKLDNYYKSLLQPTDSAGKSSESAAAIVRSNQLGKTHQQMRKADKQHRPAPASSKSRGGWHPSLNSISEATS